MKKLKTFLLSIILALAICTPAFSTISTIENQIVVGGTGTQTLFSFSFVGDQSTDFNVIYTNSTGQQTTLLPSQYTVALNPAQPGSLWGVGGTVSYPLSGPPIAAGTTLTIQRLIPLQQLVSISGQGDFNPQVVEQALDISEMQIQQISARTGQLRGTWAPNVLYNYGDMVIDGAAGNDTNNIYLCVVSNTSSVWATDLAAGYWSLALNVQSIVNSLPQIANNQVFGNISGITATPTGISASALLDSSFNNAQGTILYRSGSAWSALAPGTSGQVLTTGGTSANPSWANASGGGSITGVTAGTGLTGGGTTGNVTVGLATVASGSLLANATGSTASPTATTLSAYLDSILGGTQGSIIYRAGLTWVELTPGSSGQFLQTQGASANPQWAGIFSNLTCSTTTSSTAGSTLTTSCPGGSYITGGGCSTAGGALYSTQPSGNAWFCGSSGSNVTGYAICCH